MSSRLTLLGLAAALALACTPALAQPVERDHRHHVPPPPPPPGGPVAIRMATVPPPPPQAERHEARAGFVWIGGHWAWKGKWEWLPGHWERERAGYAWREGRWEKRGNAWYWIEGEWAAGGEPAVATTPPPPPGEGEPPPPPPGPEVRDHRHQWRIDRPYVSTFYPQTGKAGAEIHIFGGNLSRDLTVFYNGNPMPPTAVNPSQIQFRLPRTATTGLISLRRPDGRDLPVGVYNVVTSGDPEADARRAEEARRRAAEAAWAEHEREIAKDQAARRAAWEKEQEEWETSREERREKREAEIRAKWDAAFLADPDTQAELTLHSQRVAELERAKEIADLKNDGKLAVRVDVATARENDRHDQRMAALKAAFASKGGHP